MFHQEDKIAGKSRALRLLEDVLITFGAPENSRYFSNNPIRISVWLAFAADSQKRQRLLIDLNYRMRANEAMRTLKAAYDDHPDYRGEVAAPLMSFGSIVLGAADMDDMIGVILPQTCWFQRLGPEKVGRWRATIDEALAAPSFEALRDVITGAPLVALWRFLVGWMTIREAESAENRRRASPKKSPRKSTLPGRWEYIETACMHFLNVTSNELDADEAESTRKFVTAFLSKVLADYGARLDELVRLQAHMFEARCSAPVWSVDLNRTADLASMSSRQTVKADAAENVFNASTKDISWAVIDSGIDARHPAFARVGAPDDASWQETGRIIASYDFTRLHKIFEGKAETLLPDTHTDAARSLIDVLNPYGPQDLNEAVLVMLFLINGNENSHLRVTNLAECMQDAALAERAEAFLQKMRSGLGKTEQLDWQLLEPILQISHDDNCYSPPRHSHGTHVAGILAGQLPAGRLGEGEGPDTDFLGMCPEMSLYDLRVCDDRGVSDEFLVMSALQFVAHLNRTRDMPTIDGANLSLQIPHKVRNFGCGQTPVCKEANRLVDTGVCVVAAAGNHGFHSVVTAEKLVDSYAWCSIQDPGNAEKVITVGSTHRSSPHTFGISYFSSRGPTADGRPKPDIVAPGEKILAPVPGGKLARDSGTSMSAPHVSGAAAMLMARHAEMKGNPDWIKKLLCDTATDLHRRTEFQGAGLVDVLRALESV